MFSRSCRTKTSSNADKLKAWGETWPFPFSDKVLEPTLPVNWPSVLRVLNCFQTWSSGGMVTVWPRYDIFLQGHQLNFLVSSSLRSTVPVLLSGQPQTTSVFPTLYYCCFLEFLSLRAKRKHPLKAITSRSAAWSYFHLSVFLWRLSLDILFTRWVFYLSFSYTICGSWYLVLLFRLFFLFLFLSQHLVPRNGYHSSASSYDFVSGDLFFGLPIQSAIGMPLRLREASEKKRTFLGIAHCRQLKFRRLVKQISVAEVPKWFR